eukprot:COSAG04_NODE_465_length_13935_cov_24.262142_2_plen_143_part_00
MLLSRVYGGVQLHSQNGKRNKTLSQSEQSDITRFQQNNQVRYSFVGMEFFPVRRHCVAVDACNDCWLKRAGADRTPTAPTCDDTMMMDKCFSNAHLHCVYLAFVRTHTRSLGPAGEPKSRARSVTESRAARQGASAAFSCAA